MSEKETAVWEKTMLSNASLARQLCTNGMSDVLSFKLNDRVITINECTSADVKCCSAATAGRAAMKKLHGSCTFSEVFLVAIVIFHYL